MSRIEIYLVIITTVLVLTQIIRVIQNTIQLFKTEKEIKKNISWLKDNYVKEKDFDVQRDVFYMEYHKLIKEGFGDYRVKASHPKFNSVNEMSMEDDLK